MNGHSTTSPYMNGHSTSPSMNGYSTSSNANGYSTSPHLNENSPRHLYGNGNGNGSEKASVNGHSIYNPNVSQRLSENGYDSIGELDINDIDDVHDIDDIDDINNDNNINDNDNDGNGNDDVNNEIRSSEGGVNTDDEEENIFLAGEELERRKNKDNRNQKENKDRRDNRISRGSSGSNLQLQNGGNLQEYLNGGPYDYIEDTERERPREDGSGDERDERDEYYFEEGSSVHGDEKGWVD